MDWRIRSARPSAVPGIILFACESQVHGDAEVQLFMRDGPFVDWIHATSAAAMRSCLEWFNAQIRKDVLP